MTTEVDTNTHTSTNENTLVPDHIPAEPNLDTTESRSHKIPRASKGEKTAIVNSSSSSLPPLLPKQPRKITASKRQRKSSSSSTEIASENSYSAVATEELPSFETTSLAASFFVSPDISNGRFNDMFNNMALYEQSPKGTWEPQLPYDHTTLASSTNWASEIPFLNAFMAAEDFNHLYNSHSTTASPSTDQSNSEQRSSFASSGSHTSPGSCFTAQSSPVSHKFSRTTLEDTTATVGITALRSSALNDALIYFIEGRKRSSSRRISTDSLRCTEHQSTSGDEFSTRRRSSAPRGSFSAVRISAASNDQAGSADCRASATSSGKSDLRTAHLVAASINFAFFISSVSSISIEFIVKSSKDCQ
jgi:hypothetical protein